MSGIPLTMWRTNVNEDAYYYLELGNVELMASIFIIGPNTAKETEFLKSRNSIFPPSKTSKWGIFGLFGHINKKGCEYAEIKRF